MEINEKYSYKDFSGQILINEPAGDFSNSEIIGANFFQCNQPRKNVFPSGSENIEFIDCNLDNCVLPSNSTLTRSTNLQIKVIDGEDCIVDELENKINTIDHYLSIAFWRDL